MTVPTNSQGPIVWFRQDLRFADTLVDADLADNTLGWQWSAGCVTDAAPYFRVFNPATQGEKFDPQGDYVRHWIPELNKLPSEWVHKPWKARGSFQEESGIDLHACVAPDWASSSPRFRRRMGKFGFRYLVDSQVLSFQGHAQYCG